MKNIGKVQLIEGNKNIDLSKAVDLTVDEKVLQDMEDEGDIIVNSSDEESEDAEEIDPKIKHQKKQQKLKEKEQKLRQHGI